MKTIDDTDVRNRKVLVRADLNVPMEDGRITDDTRIEASLPTLAYLREHEAISAVCAHLGRPKGEVNQELSLRPVAERLSELAGTELRSCGDCVGQSVREAVSEASPGDVLMLENTRFHPEEKANDADFAKELAKPFDIFVNDAFGAAHRAHASTEGVAHHLPSVAGLLMVKEVEAVGSIRANPAQPFIVIMGGAKVSTKLSVVRALIDEADWILVGGAIANTFLVADGKSVGQSTWEEDQLEAAREILAASGGKVQLPVDGVVAADVRDDAKIRTVSVDEIPDGWLKLDIGSETQKIFAQCLSKAKTVVWNGPLGYSQVESFSGGTRAIGETVADLDALSVVGGGDTVAALKSFGLSDRISHLSTGGGAFLKLLETGELPAVDALEAGN